MSELVCPGCGCRGEDWENEYPGSCTKFCPCCEGVFYGDQCTQERYDAVTAELERRTLHTRRLERVASPAGHDLSTFEFRRFAGFRDDHYGFTPGVPVWTKALNLDDTPFPEGYARYRGAEEADLWERHVAKDPEMTLADYLEETR